MAGKQVKHHPGDVGLVRVEVFVPADERRSILKAAMKIRSAHRMDQIQLSDKCNALFDEALTRFGPVCLDKVNPSRTIEGLIAISDGLKSYGGMEAWRLSANICDEISRRSNNLASGD